MLWIGFLLLNYVQLSHAFYTVRRTKLCRCEVSHESVAMAHNSNEQRSLSGHDSRSSLTDGAGEGARPASPTAARIPKHTHLRHYATKKCPTPLGERPPRTGVRPDLAFHTPSRIKKTEISRD
ncbi:hypothetical protein EVAR_6414_1 [Eumeta japonica]|uniref:Secreted protein n=1 Tax=Eumeta variegata TaxID=151549 RepID=A0A4C1TDN1_EUMVA|nr:hypothetical protein EVAR_6414_1 [Eumeta japonica]